MPDGHPGSVDMLCTVATVALAFLLSRFERVTRSQAKGRRAGHFRAACDFSARHRQSICTAKAIQSSFRTTPDRPEASCWWSCHNKRKARGAIRLYMRLWLLSLGIVPSRAGRPTIPALRDMRRVSNLWEPVRLTALVSRSKSSGNRIASQLSYQS